jgi:hypothetical protein
MTTILVINAVSSLAAGCGIVLWSRRRARRQPVPQPVYLTARRPLREAPR